MVTTGKHTSGSVAKLWMEEDLPGINKISQYETQGEESKGSKESR